jgi:hypothetical protein
MDAKTWTSDDEPHVSYLGDSAVFMPRLGTDSRHNLMLVWAIASSPTKQVYQRYRADTGEWGSVEPVPGVSFTESTFETNGRLPFAFAPGGTGALMFRSAQGSSGTLMLADFC